MKKIKIDYSKCTVCRMCEIVCSLHHLESAVNPKRSRIRVMVLDEKTYCPVIAGPFTDAECNALNIVVIGGKEYDACELCRASCPRRPTVFREPDIDIALKCDFCGEPPDPQCIRWCPHEALTVVEVPDEVSSAES